MNSQILILCNRGLVSGPDKIVLKVPNNLRSFHLVRIQIFVSRSTARLMNSQILVFCNCGLVSHPNKIVLRVPTNLLSFYFVRIQTLF